MKPIRNRDERGFTLLQSILETILLRYVFFLVQS